VVGRLIAAWDSAQQFSIAFEQGIDGFCHLASDPANELLIGDGTKGIQRREPPLPKVEDLNPPKDGLLCL